MAGDQRWRRKEMRVRFDSVGEEVKEVGRKQRPPRSATGINGM